MGPGLLHARVEEIMTREPKTLPPDTLCSAALEQINSLKRGGASRPPGVTQMFVVEDGKPIGIVHVHDLLRAGVA
jgi:arabinose-5-phosphate isomerase